MLGVLFGKNFLIDWLIGGIVCLCLASASIHLPVFINQVIKKEKIQVSNSPKRGRRLADDDEEDDDDDDN